MSPKKGGWGRGPDLERPRLKKNRRWKGKTSFRPQEGAQKHLNAGVVVKKARRKQNRKTNVEQIAGEKKKLTRRTGSKKSCLVETAACPGGKHSPSAITPQKAESSKKSSGRSEKTTGARKTKKKRRRAQNKPASRLQGGRKHKLGLLGQRFTLRKKANPARTLRSRSKSHFFIP